jgi:hypothetical protein
MRKLLILALFLLGICNAPVFGMVQEIILTEVYSILPLDDANETEVGNKPDPTRFHAFVNGNNLSVGAYTGVPAYVEVVDEETGEVVAEEEFEGETEISVEQSGSYVVQIYSGNTIMTGEFVVE